MKITIFLWKTDSAKPPVALLEAEQLPSQNPLVIRFKTSEPLRPHLGAVYCVKRSAPKGLSERWWEIAVPIVRKATGPYTYTATWTRDLGAVETKAETEKFGDKKEKDSVEK